MPEKRELTSTDWKEMDGWLKEKAKKYELEVQDIKKIVQKEWDIMVENPYNQKKPKMLLLNNVKNFADTSIKSRHDNLWTFVMTGVSDPRHGGRPAGL